MATSLAAYQAPDPFDWTAHGANHLGTKGQSLYQTFQFDPDTDKLKYDKVVDKFDGYFSPKKNLIYERYKISTRTQREDETYEQFITELRKLNSTCEFGTLADDMLLLFTVIGESLISKRTHVHVFPKWI